MIRKMNKRDILKEAQRMMEKEQTFIKDAESIKSNPQVKEMIDRAVGRIDALKDIIYFANRRKRPD